MPLRLAVIPRIIALAIGSLMAVAALLIVQVWSTPATAQEDVNSGETTECVERALRLAQPLLDSIEVRGSAKAREVDATLDRIRARSADCEDELFADGTADNPDAGLLAGDGFSFTAETCPGVTACDGGNAGAIRGRGGNGFNGGNGGDAGWYEGRAGNGGDASAQCTVDCDGGAGGRAGRFGTGGRGGDGALGGDGGKGGTGGLLRGVGGAGGDGGDAVVGVGGKGGKGGPAGRSAKETSGGGAGAIGGADVRLAGG